MKYHSANRAADATEFGAVFTGTRSTALAQYNIEQQVLKFGGGGGSIDSIRRFWPVKVQCSG